MNIRRPLLAGTWYPDSPSECVAMIRSFGHRRLETPLPTKPVASLIPHAGWMYSGRIAFHALEPLAHNAQQIDTIVLFAGHLGISSPPTIMIRGSYWTPFGTIPNDDPLAEALGNAISEVQPETPDDHSQDNAAEVQFPLIKHLFPNAALLVVGVPPHPVAITIASHVHDIAKRLQRRIVALGSTDLTHYGPNYGWSPHGIGRDAEVWVRNQNDASFISDAVAMQTDGLIQNSLSRRNACCPGAAAAAIRFAHLCNVTEGTLVEHALSSDVHPSTSFVGYAGIVY